MRRMWWNSRLSWPKKSLQPGISILVLRDSKHVETYYIACHLDIMLHAIKIEIEPPPTQPCVAPQSYNDQLPSMPGPSSNGVEVEMLLLM